MHKAVIPFMRRVWLVWCCVHLIHVIYHGNDYYRLKLAAAEEKHGVNVEVVPRNGLIRGKVLCHTTGSLIPNATVRASDNKALKCRSDDNGVYELEVPPDFTDDTVEFMHGSYHPLQCSQVLTVGAAVLLENVNAALIPTLSTIGGVVCDEETLLPLAGVMVRVNQVSPCGARQERPTDCCDWL